MQFGYLNHSSWLDTTREERQFCATLFCKVRKNPKKFIQLCNHALSRGTKIVLDESTDWEVGFEVALGRDFRSNVWEFLGTRRTFDLACFSKKHLVIIEAKAQQGFYSADLRQLANEKRKFETALRKKGVGLIYVGLCTQHYFDSPRRQVDLNVGFDAVLTWQQIGTCFPDKTFERADVVYRRQAITGR